MYITMLNILGVLLLAVYFLYSFFWKTKAVSEVFSPGKDEDAFESFSRGVDKYSWLLLVLGICCFLVSDYLSGQGSFLSLLKEVFLGVN